MADELAERRRETFDVIEATAGKEELTAAEADAWLRALTDLRLVLGTRLDVREDTFASGLDLNDPRAPELARLRLPLVAPGDARRGGQLRLGLRLRQKKKGDPSVALSVASPSVSAAQAHGNAVPIVVREEVRASPWRGLSRGNTKRGRRPAPFRVSREESRSSSRRAPPHRALRYLLPRAPPPHRGALSVADGVSPGVGHLIYHPSTVDCTASPGPNEKSRCG